MNKYGNNLIFLVVAKFICIFLFDLFLNYAEPKCYILIAIYFGRKLFIEKYPYYSDF